MFNIIDYVKKYGDTGYEVMPFNDVDRLILSQFSYLKFDGLLPEVGMREPNVTIAQLSRMSDVDDLFTDERYAKNNRALFEAMAEHPRFSLIRLNHYINIVDEAWELQFSAITTILPDNHTHVVYRGTDESIIGWKEDLNMGFMTPIPAQEKALDYINYVAPLIDGDFTLGGHSKGGNLAIYAAMKCDEAIRSRISGVYSHDGPGFTKRILDESEFSKIKSRVHKIVPHSSIVGMLLMTEVDYEVVACKNFGILQHDPFNWIVEGNDFVKRDDVVNHQKISNSSINAWADNLTDEEFKLLSDNIYDVLVSAGIDDLNDIYKNPVMSVKNMADAVHDLPDKQRKMVWDILMELVECFKVHFKDQAHDQLDRLLADERDKIDKIRTLIHD